MKVGASARKAALEILRRVREGQAFDTARRDLELLPDADRRLAHEIAAGVLRHRTELDGGIRPLVRAAWRNVEPDLKDLLRIGAYQLRFLDQLLSRKAYYTWYRDHDGLFAAESYGDDLFLSTNARKGLPSPWPSCCWSSTPRSRPARSCYRCCSCWVFPPSWGRRSSRCWGVPR